MTTTKNRPLFRISFCEQIVDPATGERKLGKPVDVGAIWPRKNGKQGGRIDWKVKPANFFDGACFTTSVKAREEAPGPKGFAD